MQPGRPFIPIHGKIIKMAAIDTTVAALAKRNWAEDNKGPTAVFVMVGLVAVGLLGLWLTKAFGKRKAARAAAASRV
ncbi:uncharacterized protein B0I36DRAFT_365745 [Microdochium trichocladiopsis]|uniref:Uncharacterized protein n=1 Tax=Microdochium trichocladiopsis TaxID=1682393 RepID=A0A9P8XZR5_9PEZI|nr:uncharacterized protein B0I36DRAFT_365745 [Microdochium trichocladiopsis]KAH7026132.1 hypothetical protein B0I36DRAFT_365745 [Microdochium trichocladiopsis]